MTGSKELTIGGLLLHLSGFVDNPARTTALEQQIGIGTGFHGKWYVSQKQHWLGFLGYRIRLEASAGRDFRAAPARQHWNRTHCFPMLYWVAECAGVASSTLDQADDAARYAASIVRGDNPSHGKAARAVLPWEIINEALANLSDANDALQTRSAVDEAYARLALLRPAYRFLDTAR